MDYFLLQGEDAETVKNYMPEGVIDGFMDNNTRYALCAAEDGRVAGVGVFEAYQAAHVLSIRTLPEYRGRADRELLSNITAICEKLGCEGIYYDIYNEDDRDFWDPILSETGFILQESSDLYQIPMIDLEFNANIEKARLSGHVVSLGEATARAVNSYSNRLVNSEAYDKFASGAFDGTLSSVYLSENGEIEACMLITDQGMQEGFTIEYLNTEGCKDKTAMMQLVKYSSDQILGHYTSDALSGYALALNPETGQMIKKGFPHAKAVDSSMVFVKLLGGDKLPGEETEEDDEFDGLS